MRYLFVFLVALMLTIGWQSSTIAEDQGSSQATSAGGDQGGGEKEDGDDEEPECD